MTTVWLRALLCRELAPRSGERVTLRVRRAVAYPDTTSDTTSSGRGAT
jgi:hypothetical protein